MISLPGRQIPKEAMTLAKECPRGGCFVWQSRRAKTLSDILISCLCRDSQTLTQVLDKLKEHGYSQNNRPLSWGRDIYMIKHYVYGDYESGGTTVSFCLWIEPQKFAIMHFNSVCSVPSIEDSTRLNG